MDNVADIKGFIKKHLKRNIIKNFNTNYYCCSNIIILCLFFNT